MKVEGKQLKTRKGFAMTINAKTAQLILDAIAWDNDEWVASREEDEWPNHMKIAVAREDFMKFCEARGIDYVKVGKA